MKYEWVVNNETTRNANVPCLSSNPELSSEPRA